MGKWRPHEPEGGRQLHAQGKTCPPFLHTSRHPSFSGYNAVNEARTPGWAAHSGFVPTTMRGFPWATGLTARGQRDFVGGEAGSFWDFLRKQLNTQPVPLEEASLAGAPGSFPEEPVSWAWPGWLVSPPEAG